MRTTWLWCGTSWRGDPARVRFDEGLLFTNLVDFDMVWGHRNDVDGFAGGLAALDSALPGIVGALDPGDRLLITADHGVDPTTVSTDHSREYVPLLLYPRPPDCPAAVYEGTLADTGATMFAALTGRRGGSWRGRAGGSRAWPGLAGVHRGPSLPTGRRGGEGGRPGVERLRRPRAAGSTRSGPRRPGRSGASGRVSARTARRRAGCRGRPWFRAGGRTWRRAHR